MSLAAAGSVWAQDPAGGQETDPAAPAEVPPPAAASDAPAAPDPQLPPRSTPSADAPPPAGGDNVYQAISRRNPFGLLPPPPPPDAEPPPPPPPPPPVSVKLAGFTDLLGRKRAFLVLTEQGPNKQPKTKALHEGERESGVEIVSIDFKAKTVKVNNNGTVTNVGFAKLDQTAAPPAAMGAGGVPGVLGQPPVHRVLPNMPG
ncbi:MAG: hypothetical protein FJ405_05765, partial [Verrucomicrobia bacterium]|nr:hypothetical protein [Verrucomicrobiota bacterium]